MNGISERSLTAKLTVICLILFVLWQILKPEKTEQVEVIRDTDRSSDYAMTNFKLTFMSELGKPVRIIRGQEMAHYPEGDITEIIKPDAEFIEEGKDRWRMQSEHGETTGKDQPVLLTGNVIITNKDNPDFKLLTEKLTINSVDNTAYTDKAVTIYSPEGVTNSVGLHAALNEETVNLHSRVRGKYNAPAQ